MSGLLPEDTEPAGAYLDALAAGADAPDASTPLAHAEQTRLRRVARVFADVMALAPDDVEALLRSDDAPPRPLPAPTLPKDYELIQEIGHGGMGVVYKARQRSLDRTVAVKVLHPSDRLFGHAIRRFQQEARLLARLRHPNIVSIHEVGELDGQVYFTMEWIDGRPMSALLEEGRLAPARAAALLRQVAAAVAYVHDHGLIHRDLKPANILVGDDDVAYVTDFGLAMELESDAGLTLTGQVVGTPAYMSPEQARGRTEDVSAASDVYALGVILYECLTGRRPFEGRSPAEQVYAVIHEEPLRPRRIDARTPEDLQVIAMKAMRKRPRERYSSARAMLEDLERFEAGRPIRARPLSRSYRLGRWVRRNHGRIGWIAACMALLALLLVAGRPTRRDSSGGQPLGAIAADLEADGHLDAALRLYEQSVRQTDPPDPALHERLTLLRLRLAKGHWEAGEPARAVLLLESAYEEGVRLYGRTAWKYVGPVAWSLATAQALEEPETDATPAFRRAFETWTKREQEEERRAWRAGGSWAGGPPDGSIVTEILDPLVSDLAQETGVPRHAATRQLVALVQVSNQGHRVLTGLLPKVAEYGAPLMRALIEVTAAPELRHPRPGSWWFGLLRNPLRAVSEPAVESALAAVAAAEKTDPLVRHNAALLLLDLADIPLGGGFLAAKPERAEVDPAAAVAAWNGLRTLDPKEGYRRRVRLAMEEMARAERVEHAQSKEAFTASTARQMLPIWFAAHTGTPMGTTAAEREAWLAEHGDEDPRLWLRRALNAPGSPDERGAIWLLSKYGRSREPRRGWIHNLLRLTVPSDKGPFPVAGLRGGHASDFQARWRDIVNGPPQAERLRLGRLAFREGRWQLDPQAEIRMQVQIGQPIQLAHEAPLSSFASSAVQVSLPGLLARPEGAAGLRYLRINANLAWSNEGLELRFTQTIRGVRGGGSSRSSSRSGKAAKASYIMSPDLRIGGWSHPDHFRHEFSLLVLESEGASETPWALENWRARLVRDLGRIAESTTEAEARGRPGLGIDPDYRILIEPGYRFLMDHQRTVMALAAIASRIPVPEAVPALRIVQPRLRDMFSQRSLVAFARLMAGDETALDNKTSVAALERLDGDGYAGSTAGRAGESWIRLLRMTESERIRAFALARLRALQEISARAAGDLLDAKRGGEVTLPAWLEERLSQGPVEDRAWWGLVKEAWPWFAGAALVLLASLLALVFVLRPRRAPGQGLVPAAWLVVLGVVMASVHVMAYGADHLPDPVGYALAALGAAYLARQTKHAQRFLPAILFAAAGGLEVLRHTVGIPPLLTTLEAGCAALGVVLLPGLGWWLRGTQPSAMPAPAAPPPPLGRHLWILSAIVLGLLLLTSGLNHDVAGVLPWGLLLFGSYGAGRVLVWMASRPRTPRRLPIPFFLFYILPIGFVLLVTLWIQITGEGELEVGGGWLYALFAGMWVCVLWALLGLVKAARIRRSWLRVRGARTV